MSGSVALPEGRRTGPVMALFLARVVYAFNWYNVGAVLPLIGRSLGAGTAELGLILGAFLLGVGIFQVPAGFASVRFGARRVSLTGVAVLGAAGVASAFAPTWPVLAAIRFVGGVGAAFFFSPALSLIASYFPAGRRGPVIGFYNGGFSVGGAAGLFAGAYIGLAAGWAWTLGVGGLALLAVTAVAAVLLPRLPSEGQHGSIRDLWARGSDVLLSRSIWGLSLGLTGFWTAIYALNQYLVQWVDAVHPAWGIAFAAVLSGVVVLVSFPGGPVGGWLGERGGERRRLLLVLGLAVGLLVFTVPYAPLLLLVPILVVLGFTDGVIFAVLYLIPAYLPETRGEGLALGVAVVNSIQVVLGSGLAIGFGFVAAAYGYTTAWWYVGALTLGLLPLLALVRPSRAAPRGDVLLGPAGGPAPRLPPSR